MSARTKTKATTSERSGEKVLTVNRRAFHDYFIEEEVEAGLQLTGTEIKSIRAGRFNLRDAYARIDNGEAWLLGMHISPYEQAGAYFQHDPLRPKKLLLHRDEIDYLRRKVETRGYTLVPVRLLLRKGRAKVVIGLARGKRDYDKRDAMAERDARREIEQAMKRRHEG
jgi:SsrA-binding protein